MIRQNCSTVKKYLIVFLLICLPPTLAQPTTGFSQESGNIPTLKDNSKKSSPANSGDDPFVPVAQTTESSTSSVGIVAGVALAGAATVGLAIALSSSDDDDDSSDSSDSSGDNDGNGGSSPGDRQPSNDPPKDTGPIGPKLAGNWKGKLSLVEHGTEYVSAVITQSGVDITIQTNTTLPYGRYYYGHSSQRGYVTVWDQTTGKIWTTHKGDATSHGIELYDLINNTELDTLFLSR